jgi:hypothetical protein
MLFGLDGDVGSKVVNVGWSIDWAIFLFLLPRARDLQFALFCTLRVGAISSPEYFYSGVVGVD